MRSKRVAGRADHWDRDEVIARLAPADVQTIYRSLGVESFKPGGPDNWKIFIPWRDNIHDEAGTVRMADGTFDDKAGFGGGSIFDAVIKAGRASDIMTAIDWVPQQLGWVKPTNGAKVGHPSRLDNRDGNPVAGAVLRELNRQEWVYTDVVGAPRYKAVRVDEERVTGDGEIVARKRFEQYRYEDGRWVKGGPQEANKVLYNLPLIRDPLRRSEPIYLVEGEKCAEAVTALGFIATCVVGGSDSWRDVYAPMLADRDVVCLPDNDEPGWKFVRHAGASLLGSARSLRFVELPDLGPRLPRGGLDVVDWIEAGHTADELRAIVAGTAEWTVSEITEPPSQLATSPITSLRPLIVPVADYFASLGAEPAHLIQGVVTPASFGLIAADAKSYKGFLVVDMLASLASGVPFLGSPRMPISEPVKVFYWMEEGTGHDFRRRLLRWCAARGQDFDTVVANMVISALHGIRIVNDEQIERLRREIGTNQPALLVCDTLARVSAGLNENDPRDMGAIIEMMDGLKREFELSPFYVHHNNKAGSVRGHSSLYAAADCIIEMSRPKDTNRVEIDFELKGGHAAASVVCDLVDDDHGDGCLMIGNPLQPAGRREPTVRDIVEFLKRQKVLEDRYWASDPLIRKAVCRDDADDYARLSGQAIRMNLVIPYRPASPPQGGRMQPGLALTPEGAAFE